jgi:hypothetical protein
MRIVEPRSLIGAQLDRVSVLVDMAVVGRALCRVPGYVG